MRWTAILLVIFATAALAAEVGEVKVVKGTAHIERGTQQIPARQGMPVQQSDKVVTGTDGTVGITFADNSLLSVGPDSRFAIDRFVFDTTTHAGRFDSTLSKGSLAVISGKMVKQSPESMKIRTPSSIMGVRGTEFVVKIDEPKK